MQGISITTQRAKMEIHTERAQVNIQRHRPRMRVSTRKARMIINRQRPQFRIEKEVFHAKSNRGSKLDIDIGGIQRTDAPPPSGSLSLTGGLEHDIPDKGHSLQGIRSFSAAQSVRRKSNMGADAQTPAEYTKNRLEWDMGTNSVSWEPFEMTIEWDMTPPLQVNVTPHSIDIRLSRYPAIKVNVNAEYYEQLNKLKYDKRI